MRPPPSPAALPRYPVVGGLALLAIGVTVAWKNHVDVSALFLDPRVAYGQPWRLVTAVLPHVDAFHLLFNCYWLWVFGTLVEETFGHARTLGLVLLLAVGSGAAEYAFLAGGVGLSGVGYGLFTMLWVLSRYDRRFAGAVDGQTAALFVGWFFLCIVLTVSKVMAVGNIAHGAGAVLGALVGLAVARPRWRWVAGGAAVVLTAAACAGATAGRPWVNSSANRGLDEARLGYEALEAHDDERAVRWLGRSVALRPGEASSWYNLGLAYERLHRRDDAAAAYQRAVELAPNEPDYRRALDSLDRRLTPPATGRD